MDWDKQKEYKFGTEWAIRVVELKHTKETIFAKFDEIAEHRDEAWARGAYAILIDKGIVSELGSISAAALVGCNRDAINKAIKAGNLKAKKVDKTYVINPLDLELWDKSANRKRRKKP